MEKNERRQEKEHPNRLFKSPCHHHEGRALRDNKVWMDTVIDTIHVLENITVLPCYPIMIQWSKYSNAFSFFSVHFWVPVFFKSSTHDQNVPLPFHCFENLTVLRVIQSWSSGQNVLMPFHCFENLIILYVIQSWSSVWRYSYWVLCISFSPKQQHKNLPDCLAGCNWWNLAASTFISNLLWQWWHHTFFVEP